MSNTALLALSSPEGSSNWYSQLINETDEATGLPFFKVVDCFLICEACRKLEREEQIKCNHVKQHAHWLSKRKVGRLKGLYKNDPATAIRELAGISEDDFAPCFLKEDVAKLFDVPPVSTNHIPSEIYISADPNGGGPSQLALVSGYFNDEGQFMIIGLDAEMVQTKVAIKNTLRAHIERINSNPRWKAVRKIFIPENNMGNEAAHMKSMINKLPDVRTYWEKNDKPGVRKSADVSDNYQFLLNMKLQHGDIAFDKECFTTSRRVKLADQKILLREQMERYHYEFDPVKNKVHLTGKQGTGKQDDLLIALMMSLYWGRIIKRNKMGQVM